MLSDPQSFDTAADAAVSLPAVSRGENRSVYLSADGKIKLTISHQYGNRIRRMIRIDESQVAADPLTAVNQEVSASIYIVIDEPLWGFSDAELLDVWTGLYGLLNASSHAAMIKVIAGES